MKDELFKPQKFYKIRVRENVLRQVIFTNTVIMISFLVCITAIIFIGLQKFSFDQKFFLSLILNAFILFILSIRIDNQSIYEVFPRIIKFITKNKNVRF